MSRDVDERVVNMEFNNAEFEANAQETMSTLDKLKQALSFDKVNKSFDKVTKAANRVDVSNIGNGIDAIKVKFSAMDVVAMTAINRVTNSLMNLAHNTVGKIFSQTVQGGIRRAFNIEKAKFNIQGLGKDWKKISADINEAVSGTAYGFDEAASAAASLAASDVASTGGADSPMLKGLKAISGAAAMTGSSFSDIANIFTTVAGNGRLLTQQLNQFSSRSLNAAATLRDYVNKHEEIRKSLIKAGLSSTKAKEVKEFANATKLTEKNIRTLVGGSVVDFKVFSDAMSDAFGEQAKKANTTFNGVMSNIKATLSRIGEAFVHPLIANNDIDNMLNVLDTPLRQAINHTKSYRKWVRQEEKETYNALRKSKEFEGKTNAEIRAEYRKNPEEFKKQVTKILNLDKDQWQTFKNSAMSSKELFVKITRGRINTFFDGLRQEKAFSKKTNKEIIAEYKKNPEEFLKSIKKIKGYEDVSKRYMKDIVTYATASDKTLGKVYGKYSNVQYNLVGVLQAVKRVFGAFETGIKQSKFLKQFLSFAERSCKVLILLFNGVAAELNGLIGTGKKAVEIVGEKSHMVSATRIWKILANTLGLAKNEVSALKNAWKGITDIFGVLSDAVKEIVKAFRLEEDASKTMRNGIFEAIDAFGVLLQDIAAFIRDSGAITTVASVIHSVFSKIIKIIFKVTKTVGALIKTISKSKGLDRVVKTITKLGKALLSVASAIVDFGKKIINAIFKPFDEGGGAVSTFGKIFDTVLIAICNVLDFFIDLLEKGASGIVSFVNSFSFGSVIKLAKTVATVIGGLALAISNLFKTVGNFVSKNVFSKFTGLFNNGAKTIEKGSVSIKDGFNNIFANFSLTGAISNGFNTIKDAFLAGLDKISHFDFSKVLNGLKTGFDAVVDFLNEAKQKIVEAFENLSKAAEENDISFDTIGENIANGVKRGIDIISHLGPDLFNAITKVFSGAVDGISKALPKPNRLGVAIGDWIAEVIRFLVSAIPTIVEVISTAIRTLISHLPEIVKELADGIKEAFKKGFFEPITIEVNGIKREIPPLFDVLSDAFSSILKQLNGATIDDILGWLNKFLTAGVLNQLRKSLKSSRDIPNSIGEFLDKLNGSIDKRLNGGIIDKFKTLSEAVVNFAKAIGIIAAAVLVLSYIPDKQLTKGSDALLKLMQNLIGFVAVIGIISKLTNGGAGDILNGLAGIVQGLQGLIVVLMALSLVKDMSGALTVLAVILIELGAFIVALDKLVGDSEKLQGIALSLEGYINAIKTLITMLVIMAQVDVQKMYNAIVELGFVMAELGAFIFIISKLPAQEGLKACISLIPMVLALGIFLGALYLIKKFDLDPNMLLPIATTFGIFGAIIAVLGNIPAVAGLVAVANLAEFVIGLGALLAALGALKQIPGLEWLIGEGGELLNTIGKSIGKMIGGFAEGIMASAPAIADDLSQFAIHLLPFVTVMSGMKTDISTNIKNIIDAISALVKANLGEAFSKFLGGGDLSALAERFGTFITAFIGVMDSIPQGGKDFDAKLKQISKIAKVTKTLAKVESELESQGGFKSGIFGQKSFEKFISGVKKLYNGFKEIDEVAGEIKNFETINKVKNIAKALADTLAALPDEKKGKYWLDLAGGSKLSKFAEDLIKFGDSVSQYVSKFDEVDTSKMESVSSSVSKSIRSIAKTLSSKSTTKSFSNTGANAVSSITSGFSENSGQIATALSTALSSAVKSVKTDGFSKKGKELAKAFADAISKYDASSSGKTLASNAAGGMSATTEANTAGGNVANGFISGIATQLKKQAAYAAGKALGKKAIEGIKAGTDENSPSKLARAAGYHVGEGFEIGIVRYAHSVYTVGKHLGEDAIRGIKSSLKGIQGTMNSDLTEPTIRPVLDLSDVKMGLNSMNTMFNSPYALGIAGSLNGVQQKAPINITTNMTVSGAEDPTEWADEFVTELNNELEVQARMG